MVNLKKLEIKGFKLDTSTRSKLNSIFYTCCDDDATWIEIIEDSCSPFRTIVNIVEDGEDIKITCFDEKEIDFLPEWLSNEAEKLLNSEC